MKSSVHYRNDLVPIWADSLMRRLDIIENRLSQISPISVESHENFPRQRNNIDIVRQESSPTLNTKINFMKSTQKSEVDVTQSEIDKMRATMHKRLADAELQILFESVSDIHSRMNKTLEEITGGIGVSVQEHLAREMVLLNKHIHGIENTNTKRIQIALDKTERISKSILELSEVSSVAVNGLSDDAEEMRNNLNHLRDEMLKSFDDFKQNSESSIRDLKKATKVSIDDLDDRCAVQKLESISSCLMENKHRIEELQSQLEFDFDKVQNYLVAGKGTMAHAVASISERMDGVANAPPVQRTLKVVPMLESLAAAMRESDRRMTCIKDTWEALVKRTDTLESDVLDMLKRRDAREIENRSDKEEMLGLSRTVEGQAVLLTEMHATLQRSHTDNTQILRSIGDHDGRLSTMNCRLTSIEGRVCGLFDDLKAVCLSFMTEKHEELIRQCIFL